MSTLYWAIFRSSLLRNSSLHYVLNKILCNAKAFISYRCFGAFWSANKWPWPCTTDLVSYLRTKWQFWQLTLKWFSGACSQDKTKQYSCYFFSFFQDFIQWWDSRKIHYLTREFRVKLHFENRYCTHRFAICARSVFKVQFNAEFPCQVMNFSIEFFLCPM